MGEQTRCGVTIGKNTLKGMVFLESGELIIGGSERIKISFSEIRDLSIEKNILRFLFHGERISIDAGKKAVHWFRKIKRPKTVFEKLGVTKDSVISVLNIRDRRFLAEIKSQSKKVSFGKSLKNSDIIFLGADSLKELEKLSGIRKNIAINGAVWVVSLKGQSARIKDTELMNAAKKYDLVDTKVVGFSTTHTALKFVIPLKSRH